MLIQKKYYIGEFSELAGISKRMLRHYDKLGLFSPININEENGYRFYSQDQLKDLNKIQYLQNLGFTLSVTKDLLNKPITVYDFLELIKEKEMILTRESDALKSSLLLAKRTILHLENKSQKSFASMAELLETKECREMKNEKTPLMDLKALMNRDAFVEKIEEILKHDQGDRYHFITFDSDYFMHVNDVDGYDVGDAVIVKVFSVIMQGLKPLLEESLQENLFTRLGGDEFSFFLKNAKEDKVIKHVEAVFDAVRNFDFKTIGCSKALTISCGIAIGDKPEHMALLQDRSGKALMDAKRNGRDQYLVKYF